MRIDLLHSKWPSQKKQHTREQALKRRGTLTFVTKASTLPRSSYAKWLTSLNGFKENKQRSAFAILINNGKM